jgi:hypothetical protein
MDQSIPTTPQDDPAETIMAALAHGMTGATEQGLRLLEPFIWRGPASTVAMCAALAESTAMAGRQELPEGGFFGLLAVTRDGAAADINVVPAGLRFAGQFVTAWANGDRETAYALFGALIKDETDEQAAAMADGVRALFDMAVASLNDLTGRTTT